MRHYLSIYRVHVACVDTQTWTMALIWGARKLVCVNDNDNDIALSWATSPWFVLILLPCLLKGLFTIFFLLFKSHILDSNGVWYSWFCPEGSINSQNSTFLGFHFVPRDLDSRRHKGPLLAAQGTSTRGAGDLDSRRHRFESRSHGAASRGPLRRESRSPAPRVEVPCGAASRGPWGQYENPKMLSFGRL